MALKILRADVSADPGFRDRFVHEVDTVASFDHPYIAAGLAAADHRVIQ